jgi:DNA invertase Pin-like site-specific DNA recombinase
MRLIGYIRVSTEEQARDGHSIGTQRAQLRKYCELRGYDLVDVVTDKGVSGSTRFERRAGGKAVIGRLARSEADGIVVQRLDRAFRQTIDGLMTAEWFDRRGLTINSVHELIDTSTSFGYWALTMMLANAKLERDRTSERCAEISARLREEGRVFGGVPYGCVAAEGRLYRDPEAWAQREDIVALYARLRSLRQTAKRLRELGVPPPNGGAHWDISTLSRIVKTHGELEHIPLAGSGNPAGAGTDRGLDAAPTGGDAEATQ